MESAKEISTLIFSKDNVSELLSTIRSVYDFSSEVVVVYSPASQQSWQDVNGAIADQKLGKVHTFSVPPMGHSEPYQMYGLGKCKYEWIFYIDTDEKPNALLQRDILKIVEEAELDGFTVRKMERGKEGRHYHDSRQIRLFRRDRARYSGNIFEDPKIDGQVAALDGRYFLLHDYDYIENPDKSYKTKNQDSGTCRV